MAWVHLTQHTQRILENVDPSCRSGKLNGVSKMESRRSDHARTSEGSCNECSSTSPSAGTTDAPASPGSSDRAVSGVGR